MDLQCLLDDIAVLRKMAFKPSLSDQDFDYFEEVFALFQGNITPKMVSDIALKRCTEREPIRMWFMNRKMREHKVLLKRYKSSRAAIDGALAKNPKSLNYKKCIKLLTLLRDNAEKVTQVTAAYNNGRYGK